MQAGGRLLRDVGRIPGDINDNNDYIADGQGPSAHDRATTPTGHAHVRVTTASHANVRAKEDRHFKV
jgi:hypothetical protein